MSAGLGQKAHKVQNATSDSQHAVPESMHVNAWGIGDRMDPAQDNSDEFGSLFDQPRATSESVQALC